MSSSVAIALAAGFAVMSSELGLARLAAPYFGTSISVWAALISLVLVSISAGSLLGGRLSRGSNVGPWLTRIQLGVVALIALLPKLGLPLLIAGRSNLDAGHAGGLLAACLGLLFLLMAPLILLGSLSPLLIEGAARTSPERAGMISARLGSAMTLGSLVGTLAPPLLFIPWLGSERGLIVSAVPLLLSAGLSAERTLRSAAVIVFVALLLTASLGFKTSRESRLGARVVHETESPLQHLVLTQSSEVLELRVNEGFAVQSYADKAEPTRPRGVWVYYVLAPSFTKSPIPEDVLLLGLGGGTTATLYHRLYPGARVTGVELDPEMVRMGQRFLGLDLDALDVVIDDARSFARRAQADQKRYQVIIVDAFQFPYVPFQLVTREFVAELRSLLVDGGVLLMNVGRYADRRDVVDGVAKTLASEFRRVESADAENRTNTLLLATNHPGSQDIGLRGLSLDPETMRELSVLEPRVHFEPAHYPASTPEFSDDDAPVEWLTEKIVWHSFREALFGHSP